MRRKTKTRPDAEIEKALEQLHGAIPAYEAIFGRDSDWKILSGIDLTLHWVLGKRNKFQKLLDSLQVLNQAQAEALAKLNEEAEHDASRSN